METPRSPFNTTSDSDLYSPTAEPNNYNNQIRNEKSFTEYLVTVGSVYMSIISSLEVPMICLAIYAVYSLIKSKQAAPVFVINLLISDLIQIVCMVLLNFAISVHWDEILIITICIAFPWAGVTGLYFMTCIAIERYVLIAHPIWHRSHRSVKCLVCTSLIGWLVPFIVFLAWFRIDLLYVMPFIPYAVIVLCFVGSCRSLSHSISLTPLKKQLVLGPLFFVVMSYTFLILPLPICFFCLMSANSQIGLKLFNFTFYNYLLNPLVDCLLYVFMRSDAENIIRTPLCCSRLKRVRTETGQTTLTDVQSDHV